MRPSHAYGDAASLREASAVGNDGVPPGFPRTEVAARANPYRSPDGPQIAYVVLGSAEDLASGPARAHRDDAGLEMRLDEEISSAFSSVGLLLVFVIGYFAASLPVGAGAPRASGSRRRSRRDGVLDALSNEAHEPVAGFSGLR